MAESGKDNVGWNGRDASWSRQSQGHAVDCCRGGEYECVDCTVSGEHAHSRIIFKQLLKTRAIDVCQIDSCRLAGVSEVLSVLLMAAKEGILVCPHAGGVGLCEMVIHLRSVTLSCFALVNVDTDKGSTQFN